MVSIHLSHSSSSSALGTPSGVKPSRFIRTKREAFQILLTKLRKDSIFSSDMRTSAPGETPISSEKRSASAPYLSMTAMGSMPLPRDLLIFLPCASRTRPCISATWKGHLPICSMPEKTMRASQKKMMS